MSKKAQTTKMVIPANSDTAGSLRNLYALIVEDTEKDTHETATAAGLQYQQVVGELLLKEVRMLNSAWSASNIDPSDTNMERLFNTIESIANRAQQTTVF